jgi:hypothetical protein
LKSASFNDLRVKEGAKVLQDRSKVEYELKRFLEDRERLEKEATSLTQRLEVVNTERLRFKDIVVENERVTKQHNQELVMLKNDLTSVQRAIESSLSATMRAQKRTGSS